MNKVIFVILLLSINIMQVSAQVMSEWLFHIRGTDEYMHGLGEKIGTSKDAYDDSFIWLVELPTVSLCVFAISNQENIYNWSVVMLGCSLCLMPKIVLLFGLIVGLTGHI